MHLAPHKGAVSQLEAEMSDEENENNTDIDPINIETTIYSRWGNS